MGNGVGLEYLQRVEQKSRILSKGKTKAQIQQWEKGKTKYFYTSLFGICEFTLLCDTGQTGTVGEPRSKLGMVLDSNLDGNPSRKINKPIPSPTAENCEFKRNRMNGARIVENTRIDITMSKSTKGHFDRCVYSGVL